MYGFRAETIGQYKISKHVFAAFRHGCVEMEAIDDNTVKVIDRNGDYAILFYDEENNKIYSVD